ncbi:MAG: terpene cyclase/mutase family protein [Pirellulales bacterium]|nr:terpene cyclase/mutase family protein [Pirellulales bacterium]
MESRQYVRIANLEPEYPAAPVARDREPTEPRLSTAVKQSVLRTRHWLLQEQHADGYWCGELEGDTILESEFILLLAFLGEHESDLARRMARHLLEKQCPDGGWTMYPGGKVEISGTVKNYFALKLTGHDPCAEYMQRARAAILRHGGADAVNSFTRFYLAMLGQISYEQCPSVPAELMLLPSWSPINLYRVSAWSRTIIVPLSIVSALKPVRTFAPELGIRELFIDPPDTWPLPRCPGLAGSTGLVSWDRFFRLVDRAFKWFERRDWTPLRKRAIAAACDWTLERFAASDGLGAIFPPMVWSTIALKALGYPDDGPELKYCRARLDGLLCENAAEETAWLQPCKSPVWDTAITLRALADSGLGPEHAAIQRGTRWLLDRQIRQPGDWSKTVAAEPGGWCFEHENSFYPDLDDTAMVVSVLRQQFQGDAPDAPGLPPGLQLVGEHVASDRKEAHQRVGRWDEIAAAIDRAQRWILAMQNRDGGWGAFDHDNDHEFLCYVPFADHNAMIDPSSPDLTGRVLESLCRLGKRVGDKAVDRAVDYLRATQEADGSWFGRWGVNYVYGTWLALSGLTQAGVDRHDPMIVSGANWLLSYQQPCGGWGESPDSYDNPSLRGQGNPTASQTAWALLGLIASGYADHPAVTRGVRYLLSQQLPDGSWDEPEFTGTGFPRVFYLRYHLYRIYFPLMALSRWATAASARHDDTPERLRVVAPVAPVTAASA